MTIPTPEIDYYNDRRLRQRTLRLVVVEGIFSMIAIGFQQTFYIPFLNAMDASRLQVGIGAGVPALMTGLIQLWVPRILERDKGYKKLVLISVLGHAVSFLPFSLIALWHGYNAVWLSIAAMVVNAAMLGLGASAWSDWMSYLIPRRRRGAYFSMRSRILTLVQLVISLAAGRILDTFAGKILLIFSLIWTASFLTRLIGGWFIAAQYEPPAVRQRPAEQGAFLDFLRQLHTSAFGRFVLAFSLLNFGAYLSGPFFTIYMLNDLKLNYLEYTILVSIPSLMVVLTMSFWGRLCDRIGYVMPMRLFSTLIMGLPLVWIVTRSYWLLGCVQVLAGISWGGIQMASFNYTLDAVGSKNRLRSISYLNVITGFCIFAGCSLGGLLEPYLPQITGSRIHTIFLASVLMRIVPTLIFQTLPEDKPKHARMTALERFFFDPRLSLRGGLDRTILGRDKQPL
ncbi:MAG: MFS transporter [Planctomycetales bacterium]|nr:MFS transporter [Planctomycetales bacterium]